MTGKNWAPLRERAAEARMREALARKIFRKLDALCRCRCFGSRGWPTGPCTFSTRYRNRWGDAEEMSDEERAILTEGDAS